MKIKKRKKKSLSGLLIIFWPVISNIVLTYVKLFSMCLQTNGISQISIVTKEEDAEISCADMTCSVCQNWKKWDSITCVQILWSLNQPHGLGCLLVCFFDTGLFWLLWAIFAVSLHLACSDLLCCPQIQVLIWRYDLVYYVIYIIHKAVFVCAVGSTGLNPRQGFQRNGILCCAQLLRWWEAILNHLWNFHYKEQAMCAISTTWDSLEQPVYPVLLCFEELH